MQYPPQQPPANQPYYPLSEIYQYDQPQQFAPAQETVQRQDIVVYPNRTQAIMRTIICAIGLVFLVILLAAFLILGFTTGGPFQASDLTALLIFVTAIAFVGWLTWRMASQLLRRAPLMVINNEGIRVGKMPVLSGFFISWAIGSPLYVPLVFLGRPVEEILQQLYYIYSSELNYYHVQLRS